VRVGVDGRSLAGGARGVAHYTSALLEHWPAGDELVVARRRPRRAYAAGALTGRPRLLAGSDVALVPAPGPLAVGVPYVLTVHDRSWEIRPSDFTPYERLWHALARPRAQARRAAAVIAVSHATAAELREHWNVDAVVVANAPRPLPAPGPAPSERPYFLWVGALEPRKAPDVLAAAWERAQPDADLRVVGEGRLALPGIAEGRVDDARLATLYAHARALVIPSWLEGYGLAAAEALTFGTPVIASDVPALREVCGDAARYVAPGDVDGLAAALGDPPPRVMPRAGRTWADVARETREVLARAC
jgi:glycosyltransferase involved in cell wall biosynthesis